MNGQVDRRALLDTIRRVTDEAKAAPLSARPATLDGRA
jgi:hypothetical protein